MINCVLSVECIIEREGKYLLILRPQGKHAGGLLGFPGGAVEFDDAAFHYDVLRIAAKREVFEEVGLTLSGPLSYVTSSFFVDTYGSQVLHTVFHCKLVPPFPEIKPSRTEVPAYFWMDAEEVQKATNAPEWLKKYLSIIMLPTW